MKRSLTDTEIENYRKYNLPGCGNLNRVVVGLVYIHLNNGMIHELKKMEVCYNILLIDHVFLTECQRPPNPKLGEIKNRIIDIVDLTSGEEIEIETNPLVNKKGAITIYVGQIK